MDIDKISPIQSCEISNTTANRKFPNMCVTLKNKLSNLSRKTKPRQHEIERTQQSNRERRIGKENKDGQGRGGKKVLVMRKGIKKEAIIIHHMRQSNV